MSEQENKLADYLNYPYDRFLKLRLEFLIITQNDLEARILRVIERCIESERFYLNRQAVNRCEQIDLSGIIFVAISHKFFLQELYGIVQSETTLRDALAHLEEQHLIFREAGDGGPYDPPYYALNKPLIQHLFSLLPPLEKIDMLSVMKQPRKVRKSKDSEEEVATGVQKLEVQKLHPLVEEIRDAKIAPPDPQFLYPQGYKNWRASRTRGVQKLDPNKIYKDSKKKKESQSSNEQPHDTLASYDASSVLSFFEQLSDEQKQAFLQAAHLKENKRPSSSNTGTNKKPAQPTQAPLLEEEPTSSTSEEPQPTESELEVERRWRHWQRYINLRRGGALRTRGLVINEQECLKQLVKERTDEEIEQIDQYMSTEHWKYKTNPHTIGGKQLLDESRPVLQLLKDRAQQKQQQKKTEKRRTGPTLEDFNKPLLPAGMEVM